MPDHFATLAQPRRPWLDPDALREAFHRAAAQHHPDAAGGSDALFAALNAAHTILREPATRLRHLLELTAPGLPASTPPIPPALGDLFMELATLRGNLESFWQKESTASTPIRRALLAGEKFALRQVLALALVRLADAQQEALTELRALDAAWDTRDAAALENLTALQARFAFLAKWSAQLREDAFKLHA